MRDGAWGSLISGDDGLFEADVEAGDSFCVRIAAKGYLPREETVLAGTTNRTFSLRPKDRSFRVSVVGPDGSQLVEPVNVIGAGETIRAGVYTAGKYPLTLVAEAVSAGFGVTRCLTIAGFQPEIVLHMDGTSGVDLEAVGPDGRPVSGYRTRLFSPCYSGTWLCTRPDGIQRFTHLPEGTHTFVVDSPVDASVTHAVTLVRGKHSTVRLVLYPEKDE